MRADPYASPDRIDIMEILRAVMKRMPRLMLWTALAGLISFGVLSLMAPSYQSEARITVSTKGASDADQSAGSINAHVRALQSRDLALQIAEHFNLEGNVEFNSARGAPDTVAKLLRIAGIGAPRPNESNEDRTLRTFYDRLEVYPARDSEVIRIRFSSSDPQLAANVANELVDRYRTQLAYSSVSESDDVQKALIPKIEQLKRDVSDAEKEVEKLRGTAHASNGDQRHNGYNAQQIAELTAELAKAQASRSEADARRKSAREMLMTGSADALPDVQKSPLIQNLVQQRVRAERQISELSATLLPGHPRMRQLNADLNGLKRQIRAETSKAVQNLDKEAKVAKLREESIKKSLAEAKARIVKASPDDVKLRQLENDAKAKRAELERLQAQFEINRMSGDSRAASVEVQVIAKAGPSSVPVFPKKGPLTALVMTAVFLFGLVATIARGLLKGARRAAEPHLPVRMAAHDAAPQFHDEPSFETQIGSWEAPTNASHDPMSDPRSVDITIPDMAWDLPVVPVAPVSNDATPEADSLADATYAASTQQVAMPTLSIQDIASKILTKPTDNIGVRTLVTSDDGELEAAEEGLALAEALESENSSVVLIDWSLKGDGLGHHLDIESAMGLTGLFNGTARFQDVISRAPGSSVHVIPAGKALADGGAGIGADHINLVLDALDETYDHIVVIGRHDEARTVFEVIEGRFDAVMIVRDEQQQLLNENETPNSVLGFEVTDIDIFRYTRPAAKAPLEAVPHQRSQTFAEKMPRLQVAAGR